jgi:hypothetical protein
MKTPPLSEKQGLGIQFMASPSHIGISAQINAKRCVFGIFNFDTIFIYGAFTGSD